MIFVNIGSDNDATEPFYELILLIIGKIITDAAQWNSKYSCYLKIML